MPVLARFSGIVLRVLIDRTFGKHLHAIYGDSELVIELTPLRIIQGDSPVWVRDWVLDWARLHRKDSSLAWNVDSTLATPLSRQVAEHLAYQG